MSRVTVNGARLWQRIMAMAEIGATANGGSNRLALSEADRDGRDLFIRWCREQGCSVAIDRLGNLFARRPGRRDVPPIACGSHLDTQPRGGRFDGVYGVLAGLEVIETLNDQGIETDAPLEVCSWTNEEGARFAPPMLCSGVFGGSYSLDFALSRTDAEGVALGDALEAIGYVGDEPCGARTFGAFIESHIEQGPILEKSRTPVGVVTGVQGSRWFRLRFHGQEAHTGATPMAGRRDALVGAARAVVAIRELAHRHAPDAVASVGRVDAEPNVHNTLAGRVELTVDMRHPEGATLDRMESELREQLERIARDEGLTVDTETLTDTPPIPFDSAIVSALERAAADAAVPWMTMRSGAGHDACHVARVAPTAMIFVPCADGLSHNEAEYAAPEDLEAGANVLLNAMLRLAGR